MGLHPTFELSEKLPVENDKFAIRKRSQITQSQKGGRGVSKMLTHDYGQGGGGWPYEDISKNNFFTK